jgi:hypothetical protein
MTAAKIATQFGPILFEFSVPRAEWEMDATGWVVQTPLGNRLVLTNHGTPYLAEAHELNTLENYFAQIQDGLRHAEKLLS